MPRPPDPQRRAAILAAARSCFARDGFHDATMAHIALAAGMGVGSLYVYFTTKIALAQAIIEAYSAELEQAIIPPLQQLQGADAIDASLAAGFHLAERNQDIILLMHQAPPEIVIPVCQQLPKALESAVQRQIAHGYLRPGDPEFITQWVNNQITWAINAVVLEKRGSLASYQRQLTAIITRALLPEPASNTPP